MKENLRIILFRKPTLFPWLIVLLLLFMLYYLAVGIWALTKTPEAIMMLLIIPYLIPVIVILAGADFALRKMLSRNFRLIRIIEISLILAWAAWYSYRNFYSTVFNPARNTPMIAIVTDPDSDVDPAQFRHPMRLKTELPVPADNILIMKSGLEFREFRNMNCHFPGAGTPMHASPMHYMDRDSIHCGNKSYPILFIIFDSGKNPGYIFGKPQFDSMQNLICTKLEK